MSILPNDQTLFHVDIEYVVPMDQVTTHMDAHLAFVDDGYARGYFLASGPKVPRTGGAILATAPDRGTLEAFLAGDPFVSEGLIALTVTEYVARRTVDGF